MSSIEDVSFYDILGNEVSRNIIVTNMINFYRQLLEVGETQITDFNEGSEIRNLLEALSVECYGIREDQYEVSQLPFLSTSYGEWLDLHGEHPRLNTPRDLGSEATGFVTFSIEEANTIDIVIPDETVILSEETGLEYITVGDCTILVGDTSATVGVQALTTGTEGNEDAGNLTIIDDDFDVEISVTNENALTGGTDYEEDDVYRTRLLNVNQAPTFGSLPYYMDLAKNVNGVHDVLLIDDVDDTEPLYTKIVLVNGFEKPTSDEVLLEVLREFTDSDNIVLKHNFSVDKPSYKTLNLVINLDVSITIDEDIVKSLVTDFFNGGNSLDTLEFDGYYIGDDFKKNDFYDALKLIDYIRNVVVKVNGSSSETGDISVAANEVLKVGTITVNQNVVG